nr:MAG TPA: hypothetical protein [Caudoviricetes sp.]
MIRPLWSDYAQSKPGNMRRSWRFVVRSSISVL